MSIDKHLKKINAAKKAAEEMARVLLVSGQKIESDARKSIMEGSSSFGKHVPSKPYEAPNNDTGDLQRNIKAELVVENPPTVQVTSHMDYSAALEYGTSKMIERPFMRPALQKNKKDLIDSVGKAISISIRKSS